MIISETKLDLYEHCEPAFELNNALKFCVSNSNEGKHNYYVHLSELEDLFRVVSHQRALGFRFHSCDIVQEEGKLPEIKMDFKKLVN